MGPITNLHLPFDDPVPPAATPALDRDQAARARAVDPRYNVALEASAGTGKTRVLVDRYVNLLKAGVAPAHILAMTFTRKAAGEMRDRILARIRDAGERGEIPPSRWRELREHTGDIAVSTIDAFCLSLLREFPLEADLEPGFGVADDTEIPRLLDESLDRTLRICKGMAREDEHVALVLAQLGDRRVRRGLASLLSRRVAAPDILRRYLSRARADLTVTGVASDAAKGVLDLFAGQRSATDDGWPVSAAEPGSLDDPYPDGLRTFVLSGPAEPAFMLLVRRLEQLEAARRAGEGTDPVVVRAALLRLQRYFLTRDGSPRRRLLAPQARFVSRSHWQQHRDFVVLQAPAVADVLAKYRRDLNVLVSRGLWRMYRVAEAEYRRTLDAKGMLDFSDLLLKTLALLRQMDEFARSRYRLESRYHHVLLDEFQDTSRAQWELVSLLVQSWGEGVGLAHVAPLPPSIFLVGDRKQSIYGFRDADVSVLDEAAVYLAGLRPDGDVRRSIARSFRSVPALLSFVNDVCHDIDKVTGRSDAFVYRDEDRFPLEVSGWNTGGVLGAIVAQDARRCAALLAGEVARLLADGTTVRDVRTGVHRAMRADDVAVLFRTREGHREIEAALTGRGVPAYVYKGLGFFDADEIRDVLAVLWHLAEPESNLRAAAFLRSGFVRLSDEGLRRLAPGLSAALWDAAPNGLLPLDAEDARALSSARDASRSWRALADQLPPAELLDRVLADAAYELELRGTRYRQARENMKKVRGLVRRLQNKGYATLHRVVSDLDRLAVGDESNAAIDAAGAVSLMTVHAAKGLEFPVVFLVNMTRGTGGHQSPIRVAGADADGEPAVSIGDVHDAADGDEMTKEREETKRLLYVALTRARDRLYLGAVTTDGALQPGRGSLAEVLPPSLIATLQSAVPGAAGEVVHWQPSSGGEHQFAVAHLDDARPGEAAATAPSVPSSSVFSAHDFLPLGTPAPAVVPATVRGGSQPPMLGSLAALAPEEADGAYRSAAASPIDEDRELDADTLLGRIVHRLMERHGLWTGDDEADEAAFRTGGHAMRLLRPEEREADADLETVVSEAWTRYRELSADPELRALYARGEVFHEVPFSIGVGGRVVRGVIDCIVRVPPQSGAEPVRVVILEFKSGRPTPAHREQAGTYRLAAEALFPGAQVDTRLVYLDHVTGV